MFFRIFCILVHWTKVASALEGLTLSVWNVHRDIILLNLTLSSMEISLISGEFSSCRDVQRAITSISCKILHIDLIIKLYDTILFDTKVFPI